MFLGCKAAIPALRRSGEGAIINMSSTAALQVKRAGRDGIWGE